MNLDDFEPKRPKIIRLPTRIEPKVFFANERVFIHWLGYSITICGLGVAVVNWGQGYNELCGYTFIGISLLFMLYALRVFYWRGRRIALSREIDVTYYDTHGPIFLVVALVGGMLLNLVMAFLGGEPDKHKKFP